MESEMAVEGLTGVSDLGDSGESVVRRLWTK